MKSPTKWNVSGISRHLNVNDCIVNYIGPGKKWLDSAMIRTDHPIPQCELFYFEVNIINGGEDGIIGIGFCTKESKLDTMPGWGNNSWGYRGKCDECLYPDSGLNKDDALTLRYQGEALYMMGCYVRSLKTFEKLLKIKSNDVWALKACEEVRREQMQDELGMEMFYYMKQNCPEEDEEKEERVKEIKKIMNINEKIMEDKQIEKLIDSFLTKGIQNFKISEYMGNVNKDNESLMDRLMLMMQKPIILFAWKIQLIIKNLAKEEKKNLEKILKMSLENLFELCHDGRCKEKLNEKIENFDDFIYYESDFFKRILNIREDEDGNYNILISTRKEIIEKRVKCFSRRRRDNGIST
ncbi:SPRY-domain-containing protein [Gigaspora margarita]|uniref:SPRY-domain-containing protein n=1 Tax=Gigaspora margarita TaxID=4874 RepID=A0A8H4EUZ8_GIGMA|nr:SPRY-domain-containing protein [Gigaspora margarita]